MFNFSLVNLADALRNAGISGLDPNVLAATSGGNDIVRFIRQSEVLLIADSLCPDKIANVFFDQTNINTYVQTGNRLELNAANDAAIFISNEGIVNSRTNTFAKVIGTSNNIVYLNQNFITLNVLAYGAGTLGSSDYARDDIVFQYNSSNTAVAFQGKVEHYDSSAGVLAIQPRFGLVNASTSHTNSRIIYKLNSAVRTNAQAIHYGDKFSPGSVIRSTTNVAKTGLVVSLDHSSGTFLANNGSNLLVHGNANNAFGQTLTIVSGTGFGLTRTITGVIANNELVLDSALPALSSNTRYTFGPRVVDEFGKLCAIFNIPETENANFTAGNKVVTVTDAAQPSNTEYLMKATSLYSVVGAPVIIRPPPRRIDPVAQTFFTPEAIQDVNGVVEASYGIHVSSIDLFFSAKPILADLQFPVSIEIVEVENGIPTKKALAKTTVQCKNVKISTTPNPSDPNTYTKFTFADPVFLKASSEYAVVVTSNSPDYYVFICELGGTILGSVPPRRVSEQPYVGSFFKSQNASTWTPIQNQDLMFRINKCVFDKNQTGTVFFKPLNQSSNVEMDSMYLHTAEENHKPTSSLYKFRTTNILGTQDASYTTFTPSSQYGFGSDLLTSTKSSNRRRVLVAGNSASLDIGVDMSTTDADMSPLVNFERLSVIGFKNSINNGSIANTDISVTTGGSHVSAGAITVTISPPDLSTGSTANAYVSSLSSGRVNSIIVDNPGSGYITTPTITIREAAASVNATAIIAGETSAIGGNNLARYVTKQFTLADGFDAGDIRVYMDVIRPQGTNVLVYYKVKSASDTDNFESKKWKLMQKVTDIYSLDQTQVIELEFRPSLDTNRISYVEDGVTYPIGGAFKYFAIKIVMTAEDTTVTPVVRNFRAIATPAG